VPRYLNSVTSMISNRLATYGIGNVMTLMSFYNNMDFCYVHIFRTEEFISVASYPMGTRDSSPAGKVAGA
jgi:hypothetical protein